MDNNSISLDNKLAKKLKVFISSKMVELRDVREIIDKALDDIGIDAWIYETDAGARPQNILDTSLYEVEAHDIYLGLFWKEYGEVTVQEYRRARSLGKPCFIYIRDKSAQREKALENFLRSEVYDLEYGVTYNYFDSVLKLGQKVADDIMTWIVRRYREMSAEIRASRISQAEITRLETILASLQAASRKLLPQGTSVDYLAQQLRNWFKILGYRFEKHEIRKDDSFEWIINISARRGYERILVRGIEGQIEMGHLTALSQDIETRMVDEGWLVTTLRISQAVRGMEKESKNRRLFCYTLDELIDEHADYTGYSKWLETEIKRLKVDRNYIPLSCFKEEFDPNTKEFLCLSRYDESNGWIDGYIDRWQDDPSKEHVSMLGEFGSGKTWFVMHYAWESLKRYQTAKERGVRRPRFPMVIQLRDYAKAVSVESLFSEFFFRKHEVPLPGYSAFDLLNRMGKLLLIFDGFDEMAVKVDRQKIIDNFWELTKVVVPGSKVILTCRSEHFPNAREGRSLLRSELKASTANLTGNPPQFEILGLDQLDNYQIHNLISLRAGPHIAQKIMSNPDLLDLARRPIMSEFIIEALPDIEIGKPVDLSRIYLYSVRQKIDRDIASERTFTSMADKMYFLCEISWEMLSTQQSSLNYRQFPDRLRRLFGVIVQKEKDLDHWKFDMMGQTLLIRNADGDYSPVHRSLLEFFVAYKIAGELGILATDFTAMAQSQSHINNKASPRNYEWYEYFHREIDENGEVIKIPPLLNFKKAPSESLITSLGLKKLMIDINSKQDDSKAKSQVSDPPTFNDSSILSFLSKMVTDETISIRNHEDSTFRGFETDVVWMDNHLFDGTLEQLLAESTQCRVTMVRSGLQALLVVLLGAPKILITDLYTHSSDANIGKSPYHWDGFLLTEIIRKSGLNIKIVWASALLPEELVNWGIKEGHVDQILEKKVSLLANLEDFVENNLMKYC